MSADVGKIGFSRHKNLKDTPKKTRRNLNGSENTVRRGFKLGAKDKRIHIGQKGNEGMYDGKRRLGPLSSNKTRKRIYADRGIGEEVTSKGNEEGSKSNRKAAFPRKRHNKQRDNDVVEAKGRSVSPDHRSMWGSSKLAVDGSESKRAPRKAKSVVRGDGVSDVSRVKRIDKEDFAKVDGGLLKKHTNSKFDSSKGLETGKKKVGDKKSHSEDLEDLDEKPKKRKRVIRIDKYDISNKRLDDGIANTDIKKEEKTDLEEKAEMSKNAQFRAIQPSPSILAYVEDNVIFLGSKALD